MRIAMALTCALVCAALASSSAAPTRAQRAPGYAECFAATLYWDQGRAVNAGRIPDQRNAIPPGWTYAGGTAVEGHPGMVICR